MPSVRLAPPCRWPPAPVTETLPITLADAFEDRSRGRGVFSAPIGNSERRFTADLNGRLKGGTLTLVEDGRTIRLSYLADIRSPSGVTRLGFEDVIYRRTDRLVVNDGIVTRYGIPVGKVRFELRPRRP